MRRDYEVASADVRELQGFLRATPPEPGESAKLQVAALQAHAQKLAVAHMLRMRDDEVIAEGNLKIAKSFAYKATLGWRPNPIEVQQTSDAQDAQARVVNAIKQARQRAVDATCDAVQRPCAPHYPQTAQEHSQAAATLRTAQKNGAVGPHHRRAAVHRRRSRPDRSRRPSRKWRARAVSQAVDA